MEEGREMGRTGRVSGGKWRWCGGGCGGVGSRTWRTSGKELVVVEAYRLSGRREVAAAVRLERDAGLAVQGHELRETAAEDLPHRGGGLLVQHPVLLLACSTSHRRLLRDRRVASHASPSVILALSRCRFVGVAAALGDPGFRRMVVHVRGGGGGYVHAFHDFQRQGRDQRRMG